ncbi:ArsR/SmtB family transcription factor [Leuconostoc suionicum]|uniref:ArsR/SmtB family transcription factor n=1 Tax=Leuconostoc suionicum TaxID=1511761 RepID=UPI00233EEA76|nr:metalloregulator ArsR/SmtB family transcription factor [Leuconostoc suionicum]MDC2806228.1 metalloregulator ArsR/SmtB family transcription factor [Leuconostoc suionicum]MDC2823740.1 metalloregulator ArsR/SmtB family transcription factor [Leuconostoc suionicum]
MNEYPDLQKTIRALADKSRMEILTALIDGKFHTVSELAKKAKIKSHTATYHLKILCELNWVSFYKQGRNVYYHLCSEDVANLLEHLMNISPIKNKQSFNQNREYQNLKFGRSCYKHLAGKIGISFFNYLQQNEYVKFDDGILTLTSKGTVYFEAIGIEIDRIKMQSGIFIKLCLDWTERTFHLGGNLGKSFFDLCLRHKYIVLDPESRSVRLTLSGEKFFSTFIS